MRYEEVVMCRRIIKGYLSDSCAESSNQKVLEMIVRATSSLSTERNLADLPESWGGRLHEPYEGGLRERQIEIAVTAF